MSLWLVRAGKHGEYENEFLDKKKICIAWEGLDRDLSKLKSREELIDILQQINQNASINRLRNHGNQLWTFIKKMQIGDWIVLPSKFEPTIHVGEIVGPYKFKPNATPPLFHEREIKWIKKDVPRTVFDQDLLYTFGAFLTFAKMSRNDAEKRVKELAKNNWKPKGFSIIVEDEVIEASTTDLSVEEITKAQIMQFIERKFVGHEYTRLIDGILQAKGYQTYRSPMGPDSGVDILAGKGEFGFDQPSLCVQVKSGDVKITDSMIRDLKGTMHSYSSSYGLFVTWKTIPKSVKKLIPKEFFNVRIWDQDDVIEQLSEVYEELDEDLKVELPLKQVWTLAEEK